MDQVLFQQLLLVWGHGISFSAICRFLIASRRWMEISSLHESWSFAFCGLAKVKNSPTPDQGLASH